MIISSILESIFKQLTTIMSTNKTKSTEHLFIILKKNCLAEKLPKIRFKLIFKTKNLKLNSYQKVSKTRL